MRPGHAGVILACDPNLAWPDLRDHIKGAEITIKRALATAKKYVPGFKPGQIVDIGVDTTGSTSLPVDANDQSLVPLLFCGWKFPA